MAAFGAVTILMDTLHQHFLQPTPRFPLRNKTKVRLLYKHLSSLQTSLEQDFKAGECDEAIKALEAQMRDASVDLRFQIEQQLTLFYLGKAMRLRLHSAQKLLPILNLEVKYIKTMDLDSLSDILGKHFTLPVSRMPPHINKRVISFSSQHLPFLYENNYFNRDNFYGCEKESDDEQDVSDEQESNDDDQESENQDANEEDEESEDEQEMNDEERRHMLCEKAESIIKQELRAAPSYLNKYMKQRIQARHRIRQIFMQGIKLTSFIKKELLKVKNSAYQQQSKNSQNNNTPASPTRPERHNITIGDSLQYSSMSTIKMVGCDNEFNTIMDDLNLQSSKREIVSIVGMGGIGKTTLARKIYEDVSFISRFDCQAWVTISQDYNPIQVFQCLLHSLDQSGGYGNNEDQSGGYGNNELGERVYKCLKGRRYLVVIDDIWSIDVWDDLMRYFQDDNNGSRILLTTRLKNVAEYAGSRKNFCHNKCFLGSYESWNLFCSKLSKRIILSPEFEIIGREIVEKCKGLPLAITVAAGLLSNSNQTFIEWEHIAKSVPALSLDHSNNRCENIIDLSYTFLPHHLKICFLSFGCFPEDREVNEDVIVDFWVSEGFLKVLRFERLKEVARRNLQDLVNRNLVLICGKEYYNKYQMHDVLRELALREAKKENLLCFNEGHAQGLRYRRIQPINSSGISQLWSVLSRICNHKNITPTSTTSSLVDFLGDFVITTSRVHAHFKFLRAFGEPLDLSDYNICLEIMGLVHMRWLTIRCWLNFHYLPLFMLWNLQKLVVTGDTLCEPLNIWALPQLRVLIITGVILLVPPRSDHHNLESIEELDCWSCTKELFLRIPNLRTLKVTSHSRTKVHAPNWFENLVYLYNLEELVIAEHLTGLFETIYSMGMLSLENFLPNLKKLLLHNTLLEWKDIDVVGTLSKLESLKLCWNAVKDRKWEPEDGGFCRLKFLEISHCGLQCWEATSDHFPILEELFLDVVDLKEIPSDFAYIDTLKSIKLKRCSESLISSAEHIQKEKQEYGDDTFVVDFIRSYFKLRTFCFPEKKLLKVKILIFFNP